MKNTIGSRVSLAFVALLVGVCVGVGGSTAMAQQAPTPKDTTLKPPTPSKPDEPPLVMTYVGGLLCVGLIALAALIPSKRGHQD
jgi:hypothetical protein